MHKHSLLAAAASAALLALSACNNEPQTVNGLPDAQADALANAAPVELPPAITASKAYRCSDNSLFYVDFYNNNTATIRAETRGAPRTVLSSEGANPPFTAEGYSVSGNGDNVRITAPGKNNLACHI